MKNVQNESQTPAMLPAQLAAEQSEGSFPCLSTHQKQLTLILSTSNLHLGFNKKTQHELTCKVIGGGNWNGQGHTQTVLILLSGWGGGGSSFEAPQKWSCHVCVNPQRATNTSKA